MKKLCPLVLVLIFVWTSMAAAGEKGWFGFGVKVAGEGFFLNPTVRSITIESIAPNSPAAGQHIGVGDEIIQVENTEVPGRKASELKPLMQKQVGETVRLRLKRPTGETYSVTLTAAKAPR
jgi:C-terminal processing protease CtpA/Prc